MAAIYNGMKRCWDKLITNPNNVQEFCWWRNLCLQYVEITENRIILRMWFGRHYPTCLSNGSSINPTQSLREFQSWCIHHLLHATGLSRVEKNLNAPLGVSIEGLVRCRYMSDSAQAYYSFLITTVIPLYIDISDLCTGIFFHLEFPACLKVGLFEHIVSQVCSKNNQPATHMQFLIMDHLMHNCNQLIPYLRHKRRHWSLT